jgi:hypothetical protein
MARKPLVPLSLMLGLLISAATPPAFARDALPPCPPRARGESHPTDCADPCPKGMVDNGTGCACPPGTVLAARPQSPDQRCVTAPESPLLKNGVKYKDLLAQCPDGQTGTPPNCHCPPGLTGPKCDQPYKLPPLERQIIVPPGQ